MAELFGMELDPRKWNPDLSHVWDTLVSKTDTTTVSDAQARARSAGDQLNRERTTYQGPPAPMVSGVTIEGGGAPGAGAAGGGGGAAGGARPASAAAGVPGGRAALAPTGQQMVNPGAGAGGPNYIDPMRQRQIAAIDLVTDAAMGKTPSAAEIAGRTAAQRAAAQQFGQAAALQGSLSPGAALRMASEGSASILSNNAADMAANRAREMDAARGQLVQGLGGVRGQEQTLATDQAKLNLESQLANQRSILQQRGLDNAQINALLQAYVQTLGIDADSARAVVDANAKNAAAENQLKSSFFSLPGQILSLA